MNKLSIKKSAIFKIVVFTTIMLFTATSSLAELKQTEKVYTKKGYPFGGLVDRSEEVKIFYTEQADNITCRVEVLQNGKVWQGEEHRTSLKEFTATPLRVCMERGDAKKLLASTF